MIKVVLLGGGNVAHHLARVFINTAQVSLIQVFNRNIRSIEGLKGKVELIDDYSKIKKADIYIICVSDGTIEKVSSQLTIEEALVVHTSGSTSMHVLNKHKRYGVFYPLQTFSKNRNIYFNEVPIGLETSKKEDYAMLENLAKAISTHIYSINSKQREQLHVAAVFINNFVNYLYSIGYDICEKNNINSDILFPLIKETAFKVERMKPFEAQTGPARRGDTKILKKHLTNLNKNQQDIYKLLSNSIAKKYGNKL